MQKQKVKIINSILIIIVLLNITSIVYYVFFEYQNFFHSDSAVKNLLAQEIFETGEYFPKDWNYVNNDLLVFFGHTFIVPMLFFTKNSFLLHSISGLISAGLIILSTYLVVGLLSKNTTYRLISVAIITSGISPLISENLYGQVSYGAVYYSIGFILFFSVKFLYETNKIKWLWAFGLFITLMLVFFANPTRAFITYGLPLFSSIMFLLIQSLIEKENQTSSERRELLFLSALVIFSVIVGTLFHFSVISTFQNIQGVSNAMWLPFDLILRNIGLTFQGVFSIFGGLPTPGQSIKTVYAGYEAIRLAMSMLLIVLIVYTFRLLVHEYQKIVKFVVVYVLISLMLVLFLQTTTTIPDMNDPVQSSRYMIPSLLFSMLLIIFVFFHYNLKKSFEIFIAMIILVLVTSAPFALWNSNLKFTTQNQSDKRLDLINFLKLNNLKYGYASYWNAGALTVLSANDAQVRQIFIHRGLPQPMRWLSSNRWYTADAWEGRTFLLLTDVEAEALDLIMLKKLGIEMIEKLKFNELNIYVFNKNFASKIWGWDNKFNSIISLELSSSSDHIIGHFTNKNGKYTLSSNLDEVGFLHFGPYFEIAKGKYKAIFDLDVKSKNFSNFGALDIVSNDGNILHVSKTIKETGTQKIELEFEIDKTTSSMELRLYANGQGQIDLYEISLVRIKEQDK